MLVVLPVLDPVAAKACVETMHPELRASLLVVDQSEAGVGDDLAEVVIRPEPHEHARDYRPRRNIGVSRCMNLAVRTLTARDDDLLLWVSTSMRFGPDGGTRLVEAAATDELGVVGIPTQWHAVALHLMAFDLAGLWDENFFPGYYEDTDWRRRLALASDRPALPEVEIGGMAKDGGAYDLLRAANPGKQVINFKAHQDYYRSKWGGCPPELETFALPWTDRPLNHWEPVTREKLIGDYELGVT